MTNKSAVWDYKDTWNAQLARITLLPSAYDVRQTGRTDDIVGLTLRSFAIVGTKVVAKLSQTSKHNVRSTVACGDAIHYVSQTLLQGDNKTSSEGNLNKCI